MYERQFIKITWLFTIAGTEEVAVTSLDITSPAPGWSGAVAALGELSNSATVGAIDGRMNTLVAGTGGWASYSRLNGVKMAAIGTDGKYLTEPHQENVTPSSGNVEGVTAQSTLVLSLRSGFTLGGGNYGRMYLPHQRPTLTAGTPYISSAITTAIAGYAKAFVNGVVTDCNSAMTAVAQAAIMSEVGGGTTRGVTSVAIGRVVDTQRRRRNKLTEEYSFATLV